MSKLDSIKLEWDGKRYEIPASGVLVVIAKVEDIITMQELLSYAQRGTAPLAKIAMAYTTILVAAGCPVSSDDVYAAMFSTNGPQQAIAAIQGLLELMLPPDISKLVTAELTKAKKGEGSLAPFMDGNSLSRKHTKQPSSTASGLPQLISGS